MASDLDVVGPREPTEILRMYIALTGLQHAVAAS